MFQRFLWEAWQDLTLIILIIAAAVSLALGIKTEVQSVFIIAKKFKMNLPGLIWFEQFLSYGKLHYMNNSIRTEKC